MNNPKYLITSTNSNILPLIKIDFVFFLKINSLSLAIANSILLIFSQLSGDEIAVCVSHLGKPAEKSL